MKIAAFLGKSIYIESVVQRAAITVKGKPAVGWLAKVALFALPGRPRPTRMGELEGLVDKLINTYYLSEELALKVQRQHVEAIQGVLGRLLAWDEEAMDLRKQVFAV